MTNRLIDVTLTTVRLDPTGAEIWLTATTIHVSPTTELRGRIVGPKLPQHSTIEISYPFRSFPRKLADLPRLALRVVIPEPSPWKPDAPFVYDAFVELWENEACVDKRTVEGFALVCK